MHEDVAAWRVAGPEEGNLLDSHIICLATVEHLEGGATGGSSSVAQTTHPDGENPIWKYAAVWAAVVMLETR